MTSTTPTPPSAAHQLKCLNFGNSLSSHTSSSTYLRYTSDEKQVETLQASLNKSLSTTSMFMDIPQRYFLTQVVPPCTSRKICNLRILNSGYNILPPPQSSISCLWQPLLQAVPLEKLENLIQNASGQLDPPRRDPYIPMPHNTILSKPHKKSQTKSTSTLNVLTNGVNTSRLY